MCVYVCVFYVSAVSHLSVLLECTRFHPLASDSSGVKVVRFLIRGVRRDESTDQTLNAKNSRIRAVVVFFKLTD